MFEDEPPDDYVRPGTEILVYVKAYAVTRHYGGAEEGGWYYNHRSLLAQIPVKALSVEGHDDGCYNCKCAREGIPGHEFCKWSFELKPIFPGRVEEFKKYLKDLFEEDYNYGNIYSVNGGSKLEISLEDFEGEKSNIPSYE